MGDQNSTQLVDHLFREESGKMISILTHHFGIDHLEIIEDAVQEAFIKAFQSWRINGVPANRTGWLYLTAKNRVIDVLRKHNRLPEILAQSRSEIISIVTQNETFSEDEISDAHLRMMFSICLPELKSEDQIALILKLISGFSIKEIANALLVREDTIKQRLSRAKKKIRKSHSGLDIPTGPELENRLDIVLTALYLVFNEGYYSTHQIEPLRKELCLEAMRLTKILAEHKNSDHIASNALLALMCYHASRFDSRLDQDNQWISLTDQDRSKWNVDLINIGNQFMQKASRGDQFHLFQIEAAIAATHCHAQSIETTNWKHLLTLYEVLYQHKPFPMIKLNQAIIHIQLKQFDQSKIILENLEESLAEHQIYKMVWGEWYKHQGLYGNAIDYWLEARKRTVIPNEIKWIERKIEKLQQKVQ